MLEGWDPSQQASQLAQNLATLANRLQQKEISAVSAILLRSESKQMTNIFNERMYMGLFKKLTVVGGGGGGGGSFKSSR